MSFTPRTPAEAFPTSKDPVRVASTVNVTLAAPGSTIDGVALAANDRVLLKNQSTGSQNGIWIWNGSGVAMTRAQDANSAAELPTGLTVYVEEGTVNAKRTYTLTTLAPINVGVTSLLFEELDDTGAAPTVEGFTTVRVAAGAVNTTVLPAAIDGVTMVTGDRFLVPSSSNNGNAPSAATTNGIWVYTTSGQAATRPSDYANAAVVNGLLVLATEGTANAYDSAIGRGLYTLAQAVTVGSTSHVWGKLYDTRATTTASAPTSTNARRFFGQVHMSNHLTAQEGISIGSGNGTNPINISHGAAITANITLTADMSNRGFLVYTGAGGHVVTLPAANTMISGSYGLFNVIVNRGAGLVSVARTAPSTLNGGTTNIDIPINSWAICYGVSTTDTAVIIVGSSGGVTDHGALTGLSDDDHTQYALADGSRGTFASPGSVTTVQTNLTTHQNLTDTAHGGIVNIPIGGSIDYFGGTEPADGKWKFPNNQELAIATYTTLYNLLTTTGTVFPYGANTNGAGGAGSSHFRLPDLRGRDTVMLSGASGVLTGTDTMGTVGGAQTVALTPAETPLRTHTHSGTTATQSAFHQHSGTTGNDNTDHSHSGTSGTVSSDHAHNITNSGGGATGAMAVPTGAININSAASGTLRVGGQGSVTMSGTMSGITANHTHTLTTGGRSAFHQHTITVGNELTNHTHTITTGNPSVAEANGTAHQNMQPHMRVYKLIRVL